MKSAKFEHGVIAGSIIRPATKMANEFVRRLHGGKWNLYTLYEKVAESFGLMIYQVRQSVAWGLALLVLKKE